MRKALIVFAVIALVAGWLIADPTSMTVGTNAVMVLPPRDLQNATAWVTNTTYVNGQIVAANRQFWMCITNGTSHTSGTGPTGTGDVSDGALTWRYVQKGPRRGLSVVNDSTNTLYISVGSKPTVNTGIRLNASGGWMTMGPEDGAALQSPIYAIGGATGNNVATDEW